MEIVHYGSSQTFTRSSNFGIVTVPCHWFVTSCFLSSWIKCSAKNQIFIAVVFTICLLQRYQYWRFVQSQHFALYIGIGPHIKFIYLLDQHIKLSSGHIDERTLVAYGEGKGGQILHRYWLLNIQQRYKGITGTTMVSSSAGTTQQKKELQIYFLRRDRFTFTASFYYIHVNRIHLIERRSISSKATHLPCIENY